MKKILLCLIAASGISMLQADAFDFNSVLNFIGKASEIQTEQTRNSATFEQQMSAIDNSVQSAFINIVSELSGWKETRSVKSQLKSNDSILADVISSYANNYIENNKQDIVNKIKKMSASEKSALINNLTTLTESSQNYLLLAANGARTASSTLKTAQTVSDVTTTLININKSAAELKQRATTVMTLINQIKTVANAAGVSIQG